MISNYLLECVPIGLFILLIFRVSVVKPLRSSFNNEYLSISNSLSIRGFFSILIIFTHLAQNTATNTVLFSRLSYGSFGVLVNSIFFFLSGYGLQKQYIARENYSEGFLKKRIIKVFLPYLIVNIAFIIISLFIGYRISFVESLKGIFCIVDGKPMVRFTWFILAIVIFYIFYYLFMLICKRKTNKIIGLSILWCIVFMGYCILLNFDYWWYASIFVIPLGIFFATYEEKLIIMIRTYYTFLIIVLFIFFSVVFFVSLKHNVYMLESFIFIAFLIVLLQKVSFNNTLLNYFGKISLELYVSHGLFFYIFRNNTLFIDNDCEFVFIVFGCTVVFAALLNNLGSNCVKIIQKY